MLKRRLKNDEKSMKKDCHQAHNNEGKALVGGGVLTHPCTFWQKGKED